MSAKNGVTKSCIGCGNEFYVPLYRKNTANYCSTACYWEHKSPHNEIKKCLFCDTMFKVTEWDKSKKYCSVSCYNRSKTRFCYKCGKETKNKKFCSKICSGKNNRVPPVKRNCINCGNLFTVYSQNANQRCCSIACWSAYRQKHKDLKFQSNQEKRLIKKVCIVCKNIFEVHPYRKNVSFCSKKCKHDIGRLIKICPTCNNEFTTTKCENHTYCSLVCSNKRFGAKRISKWQKYIFDKLKEHGFNVEVEMCVKNETRKLFVDICLLDKKIIIECNGDYWHCNPVIYDASYFHSKIQKTASDIWEYDNQKKLFLQNMGYIVLVLWENDFEEKEEYIIKLKEKINEICENQRN